MMKNALLVGFIVAVTALSVLLYSRLYAWEGDDGGLDQWEVTVGRFAERVNNQMQLTPPPAPPPPAIPTWSSANDGRSCYGAIPLLQHYSPGWDVNHFARIMWRESNCVPTARNSCCHGLLQINWGAHRSWLDDIGITSVEQLYDPATNIRAAAALYRRAGGTNPWEQTR